MNRHPFPHLWLALSPHGFGHAAMTAPVVAELRRRRPGLRLTIQTTVPRHFLEGRYGPDFDLVPEIPDFGLVMRSSTDVDLEASAARYGDLHRDWPAIPRNEADRLATAAPDLVLANAPYVTIKAASMAGLKVAGISSVEWADIYHRYLGDRPEAPAIFGQMAEAYNQASIFLRATPAMEMPSLHNLRDIAPIGRAGRRDPDGVRQRLGCRADVKVGLIAFGGIDHDLDLGRWPRLDGWVWLTTTAVPAGRPDLRFWGDCGLDYADMAASVQVIVTKPGYGTFVEAAMTGIPVLYQSRPDWPECPHLDGWLVRHGRAQPITVADLLDGGLAAQLQSLFLMEDQKFEGELGMVEAVDVLESLLDHGP